MQGEEPKKKKKPEEKRTFKAGGVELTKEEFDILKGRTGGQVTERIREAEANILRTRAEKTPRLLSESERTRFGAIQQVEREEEVAPLVERGEESIAELQEKIARPPDITPQPLLETTAELPLKITEIPARGLASVLTAVTGKQFTAATAEELADTPFGKIAGNALLGLGAAAGILSIGAIAGSISVGVAKSTIAASVTAKVGTLGKLLGVGILAGGPQVFTGKKIGTARTVIAGMVEEGERIEADVRNGLSVDFALDRLDEMADQIDMAEATLKQKSQFDVIYRISDAHISDTQNIIKSREALRRRMRATINIARQGTAALNPEALMANAAERTKEGEIEA